ncbi:MAG: hypothetical protein FVQ81_18285 [Candidatus Glassbacteria bacterium]|nr:hypothetical protein [Candidatus Glassbacteria bacterium]
MHDTGPLEPGAFVRIFHHGRRFTAISLLAATLSSCGTFTNPGAPKQSFDIDKDIQELETVFSRSGSIAEYYAEFEKSAKTDEQRKKGRDRFITGRLVLINIHYIEFIKQFAVSKAQLDSAIDIATIGVDLAITLVGAASTKAILGVVSAGMTSSKVSIDKNFFQQKTAGCR